ncbi:MAG: hypothetical protein AB7V27_19745 [Candidatus Binatia bacterium]
MLVSAWLALFSCRVPARAINLRLEPSILGQVRDGNGVLSGETEAPIELYGDFGVSGLPRGTTFDTYFRLEEDFSRLEGETDFFSGVLRVPSALPGLDLQLGRQVVAESPVGLWDADSGQVRVGLGESPFALTVFGGQPRYWEPTFGAPRLSQDEQIFGGTVRLLRQPGSALALGYLQQDRQGRELMQQITLSGARAFAKLPGFPSAYGNFAFDADHANIDQVRAGVQSFVWRPELMMNFESGYYKPQDGGRVVEQNLNRREDPIFQLFSVSELLQFRGGARYSITRTVSTFADLSYQRYQQLRESFINGYVWSAGLLYLPGGDGLEMVQLQYYGIDSGGGSVNGGRASYENRVYENILFRAMCDVAHYDKATNQSGVAIASRIGLGYMFLPGLVGELNFEANRNQLFPEDFRFGFFITYQGGYRPDRGLSPQPIGGERRPWPWGPARFGPASWGPGSVAWNTQSSMPSSGWAQPAFAAIAQREAAQSGSGEDGATGGTPVPETTPARRDSP